MTLFGSERALGLVWVALGTAVAYAGYDLGIGSARDPGAGAFLFWPGLLIAVLALVPIARPSGANVSALDMRRSFPVQVVVSLLAAIVFAWALERLGFLIATAVFLAVVSRLVESRPWWKSVVFGIIAAITIDLIGRALLGVSLPLGLLG